jgi:hypothetical protein
MSTAQAKPSFDVAARYQNRQNNVVQHLYNHENDKNVTDLYAVTG